MFLIHLVSHSVPQSRTTGQDFQPTIAHGSESEAKIEQFVNELVTEFQVAFYSFKNVAIDEMVIGWKGRWKYKQCNAAKPKKYHIKTFGLCNSTTGYVCNILTYFGTETSYDSGLDPSCGQPEKEFEYLLRPRASCLC